MPKTRDPAWLADVRRPGPNGSTFLVEPHFSFTYHAAIGGGLMEDDVTTGEFTPGCQAYAGYYNGTYANMTAVRAYAARQHAKSFSYTPAGATGADAIDMEPGDASPADAPGFYRNGGRYFYSSASSTQSVINYLAGAGIPRSNYKIISAHYIGEHMCGPGSCGYPQADATQFTDTYLGRSLDCTLFSSSFFGTPAPSPAPAPVPVFSLSLEDEVVIPAGSTGPDVGVSLDGGNPVKTVGFLADPARLGLTSTAVRCAVHTIDGVWHVTNVTLTAAAPKQVLSFPKSPAADGVSFSRLDDAAIDLVPNFS